MVVQIHLQRVDLSAPVVVLGNLGGIAQHGGLAAGPQLLHHVPVAVDDDNRAVAQQLVQRRADRAVAHQHDLAGQGCLGQARHKVQLAKIDPVFLVEAAHPLQRAMEIDRLAVPGAPQLGDHPLFGLDHSPRLESVEWAALRVTEKRPRRVGRVEEFLVALHRVGYSGIIYFDTFPDHSGLNPVDEARANIRLTDRLRAVAQTLGRDRALAAAQARQDAAATTRIVAAALYGA